MRLFFVACTALALLHDIALAQTDSPLPEDGLDGLAELKEFAITGTRIRGSSPASPLIVIDRDDIERSGYGSVQDLLANLPQNFGGDQAEDTFGSVAVNPSFGAGINLRGLGTDSTLIMLDGRRMPFSARGEFVDVALIPLAAVERIEVLTDGASAIYGSDAIAGVVNIIMRHDFAGSETLLRYGFTGQGGATERQAAQSFGGKWSSGNALLTYEHREREGLPWSDRDFSAAPVAPVSLLPGFEQDAFYFSASQQLGRWRTFADLYHTGKQADFRTFLGTFLTRLDADSDVERYGGTAGVRRNFGTTWNIEISGTYGLTDEVQAFDSAFLPLAFSNATSYENDLKAAEVKLDGHGFAAPGGNTKFAFGATHRAETLNVSVQAGGLTVVTPAIDRDVSGIFAEALVPFFGETNARRGLQLLELSLAGRFEDYSDFGSTLNPKVGLRWSPRAGLGFNATYATSFKAPNLDQINDYNAVHVLVPRPDALGVGGFTRTVALLGNNADLQEETADSWTLSASLAPELLRGVNLRATYFNIDFSDRINSVIRPVLSDPALAGLVKRRADFATAEFDAMVAELLNNPPTRGFLGCALPLAPDGACPESPANFDAIYDSRVLNLAGTQVNGVELAGNSRFDSRFGEVVLDANVNYYLGFKNQSTSAQPEVQVLNTAGNLPDLKARLGAIWRRGPWSASTALNFTDGSRDIQPTSVDPIASWTTLDVSVGYARPSGGAVWWLDNLSVSLAATNLLDKDPPSYSHYVFGTGYDPTNADPFGRFVSLQLRKTFTY